MENFDFVNQFKALSDPTRLKIFSLLKGKTLCACQLLEDLSITQPTLSHHMKVLQQSNIVISHKNGTWNHYQINKDTLVKLEHLFSEYSQIEISEVFQNPCKKD
ncbi:MAG: metalloregulator ArsR/SmtB family transcription factor [Firmicutes bacterium]|nr:metalloregulator ArsR/SmtB family transcription factor [Bacillota bacterium]